MCEEGNGIFVGVDYYIGCKGVGHIVSAEGDGKFVGVEFFMG